MQDTWDSIVSNVVMCWTVLLQNPTTLLEKKQHGTTCAFQTLFDISNNRCSYSEKKIINIDDLAQDCSVSYTWVYETSAGGGGGSKIRCS